MLGQGIAIVIKLGVRSNLLKKLISWGAQQFAKKNL
jgi:hypothetical protein